MKTKQDNNVTDCKGVIFVEYDTKLSRPIGNMWSMMKTRQDDDMINCTSLLYVENETELS